MADYRQWAQRRTGRGGQQQAAAPVPPQAVPAQAPPPPPPGYAWTMHPTAGLILVSLAAPAPAPALQPPVRQPSGVVPYIQPHLTAPMPPGSPARQVETCVLVKPGDRDPYAEFLATIPDLVPDTSGGYDAMADNPSPETLQAIRGADEFAGATDPTRTPTRSFTDLSRPLARGSFPLKGPGA